ncbi:MAG TPA: DNA internalization-related competence protein ComEC/Rec2 [Burkholderiales bacterium]|nr:DNA internalization-related competence protein ComEC/Rec2 [Burkholderiales bacterium]
MRLYIVAFVAGVWLLQQQADLPDPQWALALLVPLSAALALRSASTRPARIARSASRALLAFGLGLFWAAGFAALRLADELPAAWEGRDIRLIGVVAGLPQANDRSVRFDFDVEHVLTPEAIAPRHISLSWFGSGWRQARTGANPELHAGERWQLTVRLKRPHGSANPNGFDFEAWMLERNLRATGYVRPGTDAVRVAPMVQQPAYWVERTREAIRARIAQTLAERPYAGVLVALAIGDQRAIPPAQWQVFTRTGVNHLMSISGLHVTMVSGLVFALTGWLWRRSPRLLLRLPARKPAAAAGLAAALVYAALAGFQVPAQRTVYMIAVVAAALWAGRFSGGTTVLAAALLAVTLLDPWAVLAPGFWLSFGAVALLFYVGSARIARPRPLLHWAHAQWAITLGLVPLTIALFQQVSIVSPLANAFAIPVVSLVVVPLDLVGAVLPFDFVLLAAHEVMRACMWGLEYLAALPPAVWQQHAPPAWTIAAALVGAAWLLAPRGFPARWIGALAFAPLFVLRPAPPAPGEFNLTVLDVGQGLAAVVHTHSHALLYDAGPVYSPDADSGSRIVVPFLRAAGIRRLDGVIVTHADSDHAGGAASVLAAVPAGWLASSLPGTHPLLAQAAEARRCAAGQSWEWDGVRFDVLHPSPSSYAVERLKANDRSCVLRIGSNYGSALLAADIERRSEAELLERAPDALAADVIIVPHHGSRTSSSPEFVESVKPQIAVFTVGYRNRFGHPKDEIVQRYADAGSRILRSDRDGALRFEFGAAEGIRVATQRAERRRYWTASE